MKFRINSINKNEFDVITEDGGIASIYFTDDAYNTIYYQSKITNESSDVHSSVWDDLAEGKTYTKDWEGNPTEDEMIQDALNWLVVTQPEKWERDDTIFSNVKIN